MLVRCT